MVKDMRDITQQDLQVIDIINNLGLEFKDNDIVQLLHTSEYFDRFNNDMQDEYDINVYYDLANERLTYEYITNFGVVAKHESYLLIQFINDYKNYNHLDDYFDDLYSQVPCNDIVFELLEKRVNKLGAIFVVDLSKKSIELVENELKIMLLDLGYRGQDLDDNVYRGRHSRLWDLQEGVRDYDNMYKEVEKIERARLGL